MKQFIVTWQTNYGTKGAIINAECMSDAVLIATNEPVIWEHFEIEPLDTTEQIVFIN